MSLKREIHEVAEARHDITGHIGATATEFHRVPLTMFDEIWVRRFWILYYRILWFNRLGIPAMRHNHVCR